MFNLSGTEISHFLLAMSCLLALTHILGYIAERLFIPRVIGEVAAGLVLGPTLLGYVYPQAFAWLFLGFPSEEKLFGLLYQIGLIMLMFCSGLKFQTQFEKEDTKIMSVIILFSTVLPFAVGWLCTTILDITPYMGTANRMFSLKVVVAVSIAVTSIPVISKIFHDLGIMHSRFAKLIITIAGVHDIFLWIVLGVAVSVANHESFVAMDSIARSILMTAAFIVCTLLIGSFLFKRGTKSNKNILFRSSHLGYFLFIMFTIAAIAGYLHVDVIFGALLAGIAVKISLPKKLFESIHDGISNISFSWFIPIYFATVGLQLDLTYNFNTLFFLKYLLFASLAQMMFVYIAARIVKLDRLSSVNFGFAMNARGGPGIVLSTVAYGAGIINQPFFAILVMLALISSWVAGFWLKFVISRGWMLMPGDENLVPERRNEVSNQ